MAETKVARRYAKSLLDLGREQNITDQLFADMSLILETIRASRPLSAMLKSPIINTDKKDAILREIFGSKINRVTSEFLRIITSKKREFYIEDIALSFTELYKQFMNIQPAFVVTAVSLDENLRKKLHDIVKKSTGSSVELNEIIDKDIIGGFILRWGDRQIDASVVNSLSEMKQEFRKNLYTKEL
jgi:F-type H+-transporting ATPase subunit delta